MRAPLPPSALAFVLLMALGVAAVLGGCSNASNTNGAGAAVDEEEQAYLQERIQKGIAKQPDPKGVPEER